MSWNVRGCAGRRRFDPHAVADALFAQGADVIALQECGSDGGREHAEAIAHSLGTHVAFGANLVRGGWRYGNALLSRFPLEGPENLPLPGPANAEPRGCLTALVRIAPDLALRAASAHLGLGVRERAEQASVLATHPLFAGDVPVAVGLDANDWFPGRDTRRLRARFRDAWRVAEKTAPEDDHRGSPRATYPAAFPLLRLDHVYVDDAVHVVRCRHADAPRIRSTSDHLPVVARLRVGPARTGEATGRGHGIGRGNGHV